MANPLRLGLVGFGNIGSGVVQALQDNRDLLDARCPRPLELRRVCDVDLRRPRPVEVDGALLTNDADDVIGQPDIDVVIELVGGIEPARSMVEAALRAGKHVVTANKAMLAGHGAELLALAAEKKVRLLFEAAVGGGMPVIRVLTECLAANRITRIEGILNGTCNYILTRMGGAGLSFEEMLANAQKNGFAERDPSADVESIDAANKIAILASLAFGLDIRCEDVACAGISNLTHDDLKAAAVNGYVIKQRAVAEMDEDGGVAVSVRPTLLWKDHPLARVDGVLNGMIIEAWPVGAIHLVGPGAGPRPTASAVLSDVMALSALDERNAPPPPFLTIPVGKKPAERIEASCDGYWLRILSNREVGAIADVAQVLAKHGVPTEWIEEEPQPAAGSDGALKTIRVFTGEASEEAVGRAVADLNAAAWCPPESPVLVLPLIQETSPPNWGSESGEMPSSLSPI